MNHITYFKYNTTSTTLRCILQNKKHIRTPKINSSLMTKQNTTDTHHQYCSHNTNICCPVSSFALIERTTTGKVYYSLFSILYSPYS